MRMLAVVLGLWSVAVLAQTEPVQMIQEDAPPPAMPAFKTASPNTLRISEGILRGMAEAEPDIAVPGNQDGAEGIVSLMVLVSKTGAVQEVVATSGPEELRKVAVDGVMGWSYLPYLLNGEPREVQSTILLDFRNGVGKRVGTVTRMAGMSGGVVGMSGMTGGRGSVGSRPGGAPDPVLGPVRISAGVMAGLTLAQVAPVYPPIAKAAHVQGVVILHALISKTGYIENLQVISGPPMLQGAAMDAVRKWKYRPYLLNGEPTEVQTTINVNFKFEEPPPPPAATPSADTN
jgi:TonB family protein